MEEFSLKSLLYREKHRIKTGNNIFRYVLLWFQIASKKFIIIIVMQPKNSIIKRVLYSNLRALECIFLVDLLVKRGNEQDKTPYKDT